MTKDNLESDREYSNGYLEESNGPATPERLFPPRAVWLSAEASAAIKRGWALTLLNGKRPFREGWQKEPPLSPADIEDWITWGGDSGPKVVANIGVRLGKWSGVVCVDVDLYKPTYVPGSLEKLGLPKTVTVRSGSGGLHLIFSHNGEGLRNVPGRGEIGIDIEFKSTGTQTVLPGSNSTDEKTSYRWVSGLSPADIPIAPLPAHFIELVRATTTQATPQETARETPTAPERTQGQRDAAKTLAQAVHKVRNAAEGARNDTLFRQSFVVGKAVGEGLIDAAYAESELVGAGVHAGAKQREALGTARSGIRRGRLIPWQFRTAQERPEVDRSTVLVALDGNDECLILTPGSHVKPTGEFVHVTQSDFTDTVLAALPDGTMSRRGPIPGTLVYSADSLAFRPLTTDGTRLLVDDHLMLALSKPSDDEENPDPVQVRKNTNKDCGGLVLTRAQSSSDVRELESIAFHPVYLADWTLAKPGWNGGIFYYEPEELRGIVPITDPQECHAILSNLTIDFPFESESDFWNFLGLMLTPLIRPAVTLLPFQLVTADQEQVGKGRLLDQVLGGVFLGSDLAPGDLIGGKEEETEKRIVAILISAPEIVNYDNIPAGRRLDSAALARLFTGTKYAGRRLGGSDYVTLPNRTI